MQEKKIIVPHSACTLWQRVGYSCKFLFSQKSLNHAVIVTVRLRLYNLKVRLNTFKTHFIPEPPHLLFKAYPLVSGAVVKDLKVISTNVWFF